MFGSAFCFLRLFLTKRKGKKRQAVFASWGPRMADLVDSPLSVIISNTEAHKNAAGLTKGCILTLIPRANAPSLTL